MKTIINNLFLLSMVVWSLSSCSDFLDKEPLSKGTEAIVFKNAKHFEQAANALYDLEGWKDYNRASNKLDDMGAGAATYYKMDKNMDISGLSSNGGASAPENNFQWDMPYRFIRRCNTLLQKAAEYSGDQTEIAHSVGTAYFIRAWQHFDLLQRFGGIPIVDHTVTLDDETLYGPRKSRYEVIHFITSDLDKAIELLTLEKNISDANKGKVSQEAAKAFQARVLLYEATWEKYANQVYDFDGDGTSKGAGKTKPEGYLSIEAMLTKAKKLSGEVINEAESGTYKLWNECDTLSYFYLFNLDDKGSNLANYKGVGKATNKEFIFSLKYDYDYKRPGINLSHTIITWQGSNISAQLGESFLCRNGLPIRISYTGNMEDAQNNPDFLGYTNYGTEFRNRDYRFISCAFLPDRVVWSSRSEDGRQLTALGKPYPDPVYPAPSPTLDMSDPAYSSRVAIFTPTIRGNSTHNTYGSRKFLLEGADRPTNTESPDYPLIRLAEVHLIYAEATCELGNGTISDADLDFSINKNRTRAGVVALTNSLIANVWDAGWWDHEQNKTVCKKMNMLDEIRRERACELFGEGFRENDLKRWGIAHINLTGQKLGRHIYNTFYMTAKANDATYFGEPAYYPEMYPLQYGIYEGSGASDPDYGRSIANLSGNLLYGKRDYLSPVPLQQIRLNPALTQNPEW